MSDLAPGAEHEAAIRLAAELAIEYLRSLPGAPAAAMLEPGERERFAVPLPHHGIGLEAAVRVCAEQVLARSTSRSHPRVFAFIDGSGLEAGIAAAVLACALDTNLASGEGAASEVEDRAWRWLAELIGFRDAEAGIFTSGGSTATLTALAAARTRALPHSRQDGVSPGSACVYRSDEAHGSVDRACALLGLGTRALRLIETDDALRMLPEALADALDGDLAAGRTPVCVVAAAGTTSTGAVDPLDAIADVCAARGVWMHVDGAYGAPAAAAPSVRGLFDGLERADSIAVDPHKWLYLPKECGCLLVRRAGDLEAAFADSAAYLEHEDEDVFSGPPWPLWRGTEYSRAFRGLRPWLALLAHGADAYVAAIERDLAHARALAQAVREAPDLELLDEPQLSTVVFRHRPPGVDDAAALDAHNRRLLDAMQRDGRVLPSGTTVRGAFAIRPCIVGHRTSAADVLAVAEVARELGAVVA